jgi:hypothetical protein
VTQIGEQYIEHLLSVEHDAKKAAELCPKVLKRDAQLWEKWVSRFHEKNELRAVTPCVPVGNPMLSDTIYALVLNQHLQDDHALFLSTITQWPHGTYNIPAIITAVRKKLEDAPEDRDLLHALARLYTYNEQYGLTLDTYLRLREGPIFKLIVERNLYEAVAERLVRLMVFDRVEATKLLVNATERISVQQVVQQLGAHPELLLAYLHALFEKDPNIGADYHKLQVELYATWDRPKLMAFLRHSNHYTLEDALRVCEQRKFYPEMAYILERMGNLRQALALIMSQIGDIRMAIEFVQSQNDKDLWEDLISNSMSNPTFISGLLENIGSNVDPIALIQRIPNGQDIPRLRDHLVKILNDYNLQMSLQEGCNVILKTDCVELFDSLVQGQTRAVRVNEAARCATCSALVAKSRPEDVVLFWCSHVYHLKCLRSQSGAVAAAAATKGKEKPGQQPPPPQQQQQPPSSSQATETAATAPSAAETDKLWCVLCKSAQRRRAGPHAAKPAAAPIRRLGQQQQQPASFTASKH